MQAQPKITLEMSLEEAKQLSELLRHAARDIFDRGEPLHTWARNMALGLDKAVEIKSKEVK